MAWPLAIGMLSFTLMGVTDTLLMGRVGTSAQAGVGLGATLVFTSMAFFRGLTTGAQSVIAAADGAGDRERVLRGGGASLLMGLGTGILAALLLWMTVALALEWMAKDQAVVDSARRYLGIRVFGLPIALGAFGLMAALQGLGDMKARMWASVIGNVVNVVGDLVLIFGLGPIPAMGERGAALATVVGGFAMLIVYALRYRHSFGWPQWPGRRVLRSAVTVGLPAGTQYLLGTVAFATMNVVLARVGAAHLAASQIVLNIVSVSFLPGYGVSEAGGVLVGRYLGAGQPRTAARALRSARSLALWAMGLCALLFATAGGWITGWFTQDPEVAHIAARLMFVAAGFQLFDAVAMVHLAALRGAGDTRFTLMVSTVTSWGLTVPLTVGLGLWAGWGAFGAWLGLLLELAALAAWTGWRVGGLRDGRVGRLDLLLGR